MTMEPLEWEAVHATMLQTKCGTYQISRGPGVNRSKLIYRAWHRQSNDKLAEIEVWNEVGDRSAAISECKLACAQHKGR